jgi:predicted MPP superfamily phosphohydrolase
MISWTEAERSCSAQLNHLRNEQISVTLGSKPVAISFISDQHIAPGSPVDMKRMREDAEIVASTRGMFAILGGDGVDNPIKHRHAIINATSTPQRS